MTDVTVSFVSPAEYLSPLYLASEFGEFTKENGMLRPNLKIDRKAIGARYL